VAGAASRLAGDVHDRGDAVDGVHERQVQLGLEVVATSRARSRAPAATAAAEEAAEQIAEVAHVADVEAEIAALRPAAATTEGATTRAETAEPSASTHRAEAADLVVLLALGAVTEHVPGRGDVLELLLVATRIG